MRATLGLVLLPFFVAATAFAATKPAAKSKDNATPAPTAKTSGTEKKSSKSAPAKPAGKSKGKSAATPTPTPAPAATETKDERKDETTKPAEDNKAEAESTSSEAVSIDTKSASGDASAESPANPQPQAPATSDKAADSSETPPPPPSAPATPPPTPEPPTTPSAPSTPAPAARTLAPGQQRQGEWTLYRIDGRDFVTMENVAEFYGLGALNRSSNSFTCGLGQRRFRGDLNSKEFFINDLKFILSYPILEHDGHPCISRMDLTKLIEPVMRPSRIKGAEIVQTVVLDAGHGGHDNGAWSPYGHEKQFTLDVVYRTKRLLEMQGYRVVLTRATDDFIPLYDRARIANQQQNAIFISVHFNSGGAGTGLETYTLAPRGVPSMMADGPSVNDLVQCAGNINDSQNMALATASHAALVVRSKLYDRGIKRARFVVIRETTIPAVLIEGGFLSNTYDAKIIAMPEYRQQMASSIVTAVNNYRRAVGAVNPVVAGQSGAQPQVKLNSTGPSNSGQAN